jgi:hypothetical protein
MRKKAEETGRKRKKAEAHLHFIFLAICFDKKIADYGLRRHGDQTPYPAGTGCALRRVAAHAATLAQAAFTGDRREEGHFYTSKQVEITFNTIGWPPGSGSAKWRDVA